MPNPETQKRILSVKIKRLPHGADIDLPSYATNGSAGMDIRAAIANNLTVAPGDRCAVPCGFAMAIPPGLEAQIRPRSGLALKYGVTVANAPGTIDSDYRGEIAVIIMNLSGENFTITRGMRIAQMIIASVEFCNLIEVNELNETSRGSNGFGSTGV